MPHVSGKKLNDAVYKKLFKQLVDITSHLSVNTSEALLNELLTNTERIMLTKRLAAVVMLHENYSQYVVEKTLKLSSSTVARIYRSYANGEYKSLISIFQRRKKDREQFWKTLEVLLRGGMPSMGKERWKHLD